MEHKLLTLEEIRKKLQGRRLYEVADGSGLTYPTIKKLAEGRAKNPGMRTIQKISEYLIELES